MAARTISSMYLLYEKTHQKSRWLIFTTNTMKFHRILMKKLLQAASFLQIYISLKGVFSMLR